MLLNVSALSMLSGAVNRVLATDSAARSALQPLHGQSVWLACESPMFVLRIGVVDAGLQFKSLQPSSDDDAQATVALTGTLSQFVALAIAADKKAWLINSPLQVKGDVTQLMALQSALAQIQVDWGYYLAKVLGDIPTHGLEQVAANMLPWFKRLKPSFMRHLSEYLLFESECVVESSHVDEFVDGVQRLHMAIERTQHKASLLAAAPTS